jgi:hypothetical protein
MTLETYVMSFMTDSKISGRQNVLQFYRAISYLKAELRTNVSENSSISISSNSWSLETTLMHATYLFHDEQLFEKFDNLNLSCVQWRDYTAQYVLL